MTLEEIEEQWGRDSGIDESNLAGAAAAIPKLHHKYYTLFAKEALRAKKLRSDLADLERAKSEFYSGSMSQEDLAARGWKPNPLKILRQDLPKYIDSDPDVVKMSLKIAYVEACAKYLEDIVRQVHNRNYVVKSIQDWLRFQSGG